MAITVTLTSSPSDGSTTAPKMMLQSASAALEMISAASLTSNRPRSLPPVMFSRMPIAPSTLASSSGELMAALAASTARFSPPATPMPMRARAGFPHDRAHVGEVEVDEARHGDEVGDALHALAQHVVGDLEGVDDRGAALDHLQQPVVGDDDQRVDLGAQLANAVLGLTRPAFALEHERPRHHSDRQRTELLRELGDHRGGAGAGAAALAGGHEDHVRTLHRIAQLVLALDGGLVADVGIGARAQTPRDLAADVDLHVGVAHLQRLRVGVDRDELHTAKAGVDHAVDGIGAAAADADDLDDREVVA